MGLTWLLLCTPHLPPHRNSNSTRKNDLRGHQAKLTTTQHNFNPTIFWGGGSYILPIGLTLPVFLDKNNFGYKSFWPNFFFDPKNFFTPQKSYKKNFDPKIFLTQKSFWPKTFMGQQFFFDPTFFWPNIFWPKKKLLTQKMFFYPKNFWHKIFFWPKIFFKQKDIFFDKFFWQNIWTTFSTTKIV